MARKCILTGKRPLAGNKVSHAHNTSRMRQLPNIQTKRLFVPEINRTIRVKLSVAALRTISKVGLLPFLQKKGLNIKQISR